MFTHLAETLSGDWVITRKHTDDPDAETELARFNTSATTEGSFAHGWMLEAAAQFAARMDVGRDGVCVRSHSTAHRNHMQGLVIDEGGVVYGGEVGA